MKARALKAIIAAVLAVSMLAGCAGNTSSGGSSPISSDTVSSDVTTSGTTSSEAGSSDTVSSSEISADESTSQDVSAEDSSESSTDSSAQSSEQSTTQSGEEESSNDTSEPAVESEPGVMRDITSQQLVDDMTFGWNLGNTLDVCQADRDGDGKVNEHVEEGEKVDETLWGNPKATYELFAQL